VSILRSIIDSATAALCYVKQGRRVAAAPDPRDGLVKINVGCGLAVCDGWINVDASLNAMVAAWPQSAHRVLYRLSGASQYYSSDEYCGLLENHRYVHHDAAYGLPFADNAADFIYSSHFLEHLFKDEAQRVLRESLRVLKPGGTVRVCVPDLAHAVALYEIGDKRAMLENYFFVEDRASFLARHKYMYDFELLAAELAAAGFDSVELSAYREGRTPDIARLDNRPAETLYVEAAKPLSQRRTDSGPAHQSAPHGPATSAD
jgi:SAM-dependent methyltransferase